jgi:sigma-B regulation protein RsbU (phosphoserine phosphatase)
MTTLHSWDAVAPPTQPLAESESTLRSAMASVRDRLAVDVITVLQLDPGSRHLVTVITDSSTPVPPAHHRVPVGIGLAGTVALAGTPIFLDEVHDDDLVNPVLLTLGVRSVLAVPLFQAGAITGVLKVGTTQRRTFGPEEIAATQDVAVEVEAALEEYLAANDRVAAAALQRSLVPTRLPRIEGLDFAGRYIPGQGGASGDWYDVFPLPDGRVGVAMGDVAGHGLPAAVVMGRLRSALRAYALEYDDPAEVLTHLDAKIVHFEPGAMATAVYGIAEPPFRRMRVASAGHLLPIRVAPDGTSAQIDVPVSLPLGVDLGGTRHSGHVEMDPGSSLVMFTDGLVERRTCSTERSAAVFATIDTALAQLRGLLGPGDADATASRVLDSMLTIEPPSDDVALLVVRRRWEDEPG